MKRIVAIAGMVLLIVVGGAAIGLVLGGIAWMALSTLLAFIVQLTTRQDELLQLGCICGVGVLFTLRWLQQFVRKLGRGVAPSRV
jgi:hypothetical protein